MTWLDLLFVSVWGVVVGMALMAWRDRAKSEVGSRKSEVGMTEGSLGALAVPDTEPIWLAFNLILDIAERETIETARRWSNEPNKCMAAVNAGDGINLVRIKLNEARQMALKGNQ